MSAVLDWNHAHPQPEALDPQGELDRQLLRKHVENLP